MFYRILWVIVVHVVFAVSPQKDIKGIEVMRGIYKCIGGFRIGKIKKVTR